MQAMHIAGMDLNLALVLHALLEERNVSRAGKRIGLSQSATSHALSRLRDLLGDPLFVRTATGLAPTARAKELAAPLADGLQAVERALFDAPVFDPKTAQRAFRLAINDYAERVMLPTLLQRFASRAPAMEVWSQTWPADPLRAITQGDIDLVIAPSDLFSGLESKVLWRDHFVGVCRRGHPLLRQKVTVKRYAEAKHALIAPSGRPGGVVDKALAERGYERRIAFATPSFLTAPHVVAKTDLILTVPHRIALALKDELDLETFTPPLALPSFAVAMFWHARHEADPSHRFLREQLELASRQT